MSLVAERPRRPARFRSRLRLLPSRPQSTRPRARPVAYTLVLAACAALTALGWPRARAHLQALAVLRQLSGQPVSPALARLVQVPVTTTDLSLPLTAADGSPQPVRARLYLPAGRPDAPGIVVFHGVHHLGIDEPRLVSFARALASCGLRVLTPELPAIKDYHVGPASIRTIGESALWFARQPSSPNTSSDKPRTVGVMGLSFSGGLALVAAADPLYAPAMRFVFAVGSQDSMDRVTRYYRTGEDLRPDGTLDRLAPHEYGPLVLEYEYLDDLLPALDVPAVRAVLRAHLYEDKPAEAAAFLALNDKQKRETVALMDSTSAETRARIAAVLTQHTAELAAVSPNGHLHTLRTPVYLLHGQADNIIPAAETEWMASELPPDELKATLISPVLSHIDLDGPSPGARDQWRLLHLFALVLEAAQS